MNPLYLDTARLLIQVAPLVFADGAFALKGGTAINLFMRAICRGFPSTSISYSSTIACPVIRPYSGSTRRSGRLLPGSTLAASRHGRQASPEGWRPS